MDIERLYDQECRLHDAKKAECLRLDKMLRECEEYRGEFDPYARQAIWILAALMAGVMFWLTFWAYLILY